MVLCLPFLESSARPLGWWLPRCKKIHFCSRQVAGLEQLWSVAHAGKPHVEVGIGNLPLALTVATLLLATGKTVSLKRKEVGQAVSQEPVSSPGQLAALHSKRRTRSPPLLPTAPSCAAAAAGGQPGGALPTDRTRRQVRSLPPGAGGWRVYMPSVAACCIAS